MQSRKQIGKGLTREGNRENSKKPGSEVLKKGRNLRYCRNREECEQFSECVQYLTTGSGACIN